MLGSYFCFELEPYELSDPIVEEWTLIATSDLTRKDFLTSYAYMVSELYYTNALAMVHLNKPSSFWFLEPVP